VLEEVIEKENLTPLFLDTSVERKVRGRAASE
jgi:hypothetical protein